MSGYTEDIVDRLNHARGVDDPFALMAEAASEITRLKEVNSDLLEACKEAHVCLTTTFRDMGARHDAAIKQVLAAIQKAEGQS